MESQFLNWCGKLSEAVNVAMNAEVAQEDRIEAYQLCEEFKELAPFSECVACGLQFADIKNSTVIRHFGLQLLEHSVKFRWNTTSPDDKLFLKDSVLRLFQSGTENLLQEQMCIKDGLSRILVEMIKREWPQHWPSLMNEFNSLCSQGETQTELVLLVLLRLVEDVVTFQSLQTNRRRDVLQALTSNMAEFFTFMLQLLTHHVQGYKQLTFVLLFQEEDYETSRGFYYCLVYFGSMEKVSRSSSERKLASSIRVSQAVLLTLTGYVEWVTSQHIFASNNVLLSTLYALLDIPELKLNAVEVLQLIVNRKGKPEERYPLLILFSADAIKTILSAAESACAVGLDEENYIFLKRLCQVLTGLGAQLCVLWGSDMKEVGRPESFPDFLQALLAFFSHPSMNLCSMVVPLFSAFFRHDQISIDEYLQAVVPKILELLTVKLQKVGYPSRDDSPTCAYSLLDYDSDEEFSYSFAIHRSHQTELLRLITGHCPHLTSQVACNWFRQLLESPLNLEPGKDTCTPHSTSFIRWDALTCFLENGLGRLFHIDALTDITPELVQLLQMALAFQIKDPVILSCVLSTISTLFSIVKEKPELMNSFLDKIFSAAVFSLPGQTKKTRTRPVQNVRRHACSALLKICRDNSMFMVHFFDHLYARIKQLNEDADQLTQLEKSTLNEALILLSNEFKHLDKQSALIQEIMQPFTVMWMADTLKEVLSNEMMFLEYIGLAKIARSHVQEDQEGANRATILTCLATMMAVMKRSKWPDDPQEAVAGGFQVRSIASAGIMYRNPCFSHVLPMLDNVLTLLRIMNAIWAPGIRATVPVDYVKVFDIPENDKNAVLGLTQPSSDNYELPANRSPAEKIQGFLSTAQENCCHVLACAFDNMGYELFVSDDFIKQLLDSTFMMISHASNNRLRPILRVFLKSLVQHSPADCQDRVLLPILNCLCNFMFHRLSSQWEMMNEQLIAGYGECSESREANQESQEILDEMFLRLITRDYLDLLTTIFRKRADCLETSIESGDKIMMMESDASPSVEACHKTSEADQLSELGKKMLQHESLCKSMVLSIYSAFLWNDTQTCIKTLNICWPVFLQIVERTLLPCAANWLFTCLLQGLQIHGQHEACMAWLIQRTFQHYEILRPKFDTLQKAMLQIPGVTRESLESFDRRFVFNSDNRKATSDKSRRDHFKKLVSGIIGKHIGQKFKREVIIKNLEPLNKPWKHRDADGTGMDAEIGLVALFAQDS